MVMRAGMRRRRRQGALGLCLILAALPAAAQVGPLNYQNLFFDQGSNARNGNYLAAEAGVFYIDNATSSPNGASDTLGEVGLIGNAANQGARLGYHIDSDIAVAKYFHDTYSTEPTGYFDGMADVKIVPGFFSWIGRETYSQLLISAFGPATPGNLENLNYITTGPRFTLRPTLRTTVTLDVLYSWVDTHSSSPLYVDIDNRRYGGILTIERAFSSVASVYATGSYRKVEFTDTAINNDFSIAQGSVGYKLQGARTLLDVSAGYTQLRLLDVPVAIQSVVGTLEHVQTEAFGAANWSFDLSRLITPNQRLALIASQQLVDVASGWQLGFDQAVPTVAAPQLAIGAPFTQRSFGVDWRWQASRTTFDVALFDLRDHYRLTLSTEHELVTSARNVKDAGAVVARQLSPILNWDIGVHFQHQNLEGLSAANSTTELTDLRWQVGRRVVLRFVLAHSDYFGARDNQVGVMASYALLEGAQRGLIQPGEAPAVPSLSPVAPTSMLPQQ